MNNTNNGRRTWSGTWSRNQHIMKDYLFAMCMENAKKPGYVTEKIVKGFQAGCVPIYWGDNMVYSFFNSDAFIDVSKYPSTEKAAEAVINIIKDSHKLQKYQQAHVFANNQVPDYLLWNESEPQKWMIPMINILQNELVI
jgi:hypothetical protein